MTTQVKTRTYQGGTLDELLPKIREELGDDAIVVRQREGLTGGVGGFFQKRCVEVEARAGMAAPPAPSPGGFSVTDGPDATPTGTPPAPPPSPSVAEAMLAEASAGFGERLAEAQQEQAAIGAAPPAAAAPTLGDALSVDELLSGVTPSAPAAPPAPAPAEPDPAPAFEPEPQVAPVVPPASARAYGRVVTSPQVDALPPQPAAPSPADAAPAPEAPAAAAPGPPAAPATPLPPASVAADEVARPARAERAISGLTDRGLAAAFAQDIVDGVLTLRAPLQPGVRLGGLVANELAQRIPVAPLSRPGTTAWVGAGGSGKTSVVAAFARAHAQAGTLPVAVVALHAADEGAGLRAALAGTGVDVHAASDDTVAEPLVQWLVASGATVVLDTPGVSPRNVAEIKALGRRLRRLGVQDVHLCIPATLGGPVARDVLEAVAPLKPTALTITHGDETERLGAAVQLAIDSGLPISYVNEAGSTGRGLRAADPMMLAKVLAG